LVATSRGRRGRWRRADVNGIYQMTVGPRPGSAERRFLIRARQTGYDAQEVEVQLPRRADRSEATNAKTPVAARWLTAIARSPRLVPGVRGRGGEGKTGRLLTVR
jgi:hypothetical protein